MKQIVFIPLSIFIAVVFVATPVWGNWIENGTPVCTETGEQSYPWIIEDDAGGAFMAWEDVRSGDRAIYAQRIDSAGTNLWTPDGVPVSIVAGEKLRPFLIRDDSDGVIICWYDWRNGSDYDIYAQRLDGSGNALWTTDGVVLCGAAGDQEMAFSIPDGAGGAIVTWYDARNGDWDIYAQRIDSGGSIIWTEDGVVVCQTTGDQEWVRIVSDDAGGAIIVWCDARGVDYDIYAQRLDPAGNSLWTVNGALVCGAWNDQTSAQLVSDGNGGAIVTWSDNRSGNMHIYAQRIDSSGTALWTADGVSVNTFTSNQVYPDICSDGNGGAIICWQDHRYSKKGYDAYIQKIDAGGAVQWDPDGVAVSEGYFDEVNLHIISDGAGGAICTWQYGDAAIDIEAQRILSDGSPYSIIKWIGICRAAHTQALGHLAPDATGDAIIVWYDYRSANYDIYAYRVDFDGEYPPEIISITDQTGDGGGWLDIIWEKSAVDYSVQKHIHHYSVWQWLPLSRFIPCLGADRERVRQRVSDIFINSSKPVRFFSLGNRLAVFQGSGSCASSGDIL
jgi:hypothetical protein